MAAVLSARCVCVRARTRACHLQGQRFRSALLLALHRPLSLPLSLPSSAPAAHSRPFRHKVPVLHAKPQAPTTKHHICTQAKRRMLERLEESEEVQRDQWTKLKGRLETERVEVHPPAKMHLCAGKREEIQGADAVCKLQPDHACSRACLLSACICMRIACVDAQALKPVNACAHTLEFR